MIRLIEYTLRDGTAGAHEAALRAFLEALGTEADGTFSYTSYRSEDPTRFFGLFEYTDEAARQRFFDSAAFATFRAGAVERFAGPPEGVEVELIGRAG